MAIGLFILAAAGSLAAMQGGGRLISESDELIELRYGWPADAEPEPALRVLLIHDLEALRQAAREQAGDERRRLPGSWPYERHALERIWTVAGSNSQLLSLSATTTASHPPYEQDLWFSGLLWDRAAQRQIRLAAVAGPPEYRLRELCRDALVAMVDEGSAQEPHPDACSWSSVEAALPVDRDGNGRFETIVFRFPLDRERPGRRSLVIHAPLEPRDLGAISERFRAGFEAMQAAR